MSLLYGNSGSFRAVTLRMAAYHGGGYHGRLSGYRLFLGAAPTRHLTLTRRLLGKQTNFLFLADFRRKQQSPVHLVLPERHSGHNTSGGNGAVLPFFGCARAGLCAERRQKQPRPKVHLRVLRGALPHNSPADMSQFIS